MGSLLQTSLTFVLEFLLSIVSLIIFIFIMLPISLVFVPVYLWRLILITYVKFFRKDYVKIMGGKNPILAVDDIHGRPLCTIVGMGAFDGADVESCKEFAKTSVYGIDLKTKKLLHPETQQYYEEWMGFMWWKWEERFDITEHVSVWKENTKNDVKKINEDQFIAIVGILEAAPFPKRKSPWECVLIGNVMLKGVANPDSPKTIVLFRFHHGFADGIAMMQLFMKCVFTDSFDKVAKPAFVERTACQKRLYQLGAALQLPYQFFKQGITSMDVNDWHIPEKRLTRKIHKAWSSRIPISVIKEIKSQYNVGFTSVLVCAITGAIRKMMIKQNIVVPPTMHAILPLPWPHHPPGLNNHWSYGFMELPVGTPDMKKRLGKLHRYIETMKRSPIPAVNFAILKFANLLPTWMIKRIMVTNYFPTVVLSNFPGPPADSQGVGGFPLVDSMFTGGPLRGNIGISITILSYDGALRIVTGIDSAILTTQAMTKEFIQMIEQEFVKLKDAEYA